MNTSNYIHIVRASESESTYIRSLLLVKKISLSFFRIDRCMCIYSFICRRTRQVPYLSILSLTLFLQYCLTYSSIRNTIERYKKACSDSSGATTITEINAQVSHVSLPINIIVRYNICLTIVAVYVCEFLVFTMVVIATHAYALVASTFIR